MTCLFDLGGGGGGCGAVANQCDTIIFTPHYTRAQIRFHAALLLERLRACPATRPALAALNPMLLHAHKQVLAQMTRP